MVKKILDSKYLLQTMAKADPNSEPERYVELGYIRKNDAVRENAAVHWPMANAR